MNQRGINADAALTAAQDQRFINTLFDVVDNSITGKRTVYVSKRPGFKLGSTFGTGTKSAIAVCDNFGFTSMSGPCVCTAVNVLPTTWEFFVNTTAIGTTTSSFIYAAYITQAIVNGEETYLITINATSGFFVGTTGMAGGVTFTADTTNTSTTLNNVSSTTGLVIGQALSGTGIAAGARIESIGATTLVMTIAATATNSTVTITRERMSKIIAANFPTPIGPMVEMNGFVFVAQNASINVWHSPLNSITSAWNAASFIPADDTPGYVTGLSRLKDNIVAHKTDAIQQFYNKGNATGSVLAKVQGSTQKFGTLHTSGGLLSIAFGTTFAAVDDLVVIAYAGVYVSVGGPAVKVSNDVIDRVITNGTAAASRLMAFQLMGRYYILIQISASVQLLYDMANKLWVEFSHAYAPAISKHLGYAVYLGGDANTIAQHYFPWVGAAQTPVYQDDAASYTMTIQTSKIDHGTDKRKFVRSVRLIGDVQASGTATLTCSDDDYATNVTLGTFDMTSMVKKITRCGSYKGGRSYRITHSANTAFRAEAIEIEYDVGTS